MNKLRILTVLGLIAIFALSTCNGVVAKEMDLDVGFLSFGTDHQFSFAVYNVSWIGSRRNLQLLHESNFDLKCAFPKSINVKIYPGDNISFVSTSRAWVPVDIMVWGWGEQMITGYTFVAVENKTYKFRINTCGDTVFNDGNLDVDMYVGSGKYPWITVQKGRYC
ncbi:MAG: hypothetical protein LBR15_00500 [Methanobrevibacter sp.]|jgi:hypothetical protein|nr:hypothetical protein [Candidatus Methanovirga australis]